MSRVSHKIVNRQDAARAGGPSEAIQVVARTFDIMRCFDEAHLTLSNGEICRRTELPPSTVSRLTHTLTEIGQLSYLPEQRRYRLGAKAIALGSSMLRGLQARSVIRSLMQELAAEFSGNVSMTVRDGFDLVVVECSRSPNAVGLHAEIGTRKPVALTASGRALLLASPPQVFDGFVASLAKRAPLHAKKLSSWAKINKRIFVAEGYTTSMGDENPHINGIAVALWSPELREHVALSVAVLSNGKEFDQLKRRLVPRLDSVKREIEALPGF